MRTLKSFVILCLLLCGPKVQAVTDLFEDAAIYSMSSCLELEFISILRDNFNGCDEIHYRSLYTRRFILEDTIDSDLICKKSNLALHLNLGLSDGELEMELSGNKKEEWVSEYIPILVSTEKVERNKKRAWPNPNMWNHQKAKDSVFLRNAKDKKRIKNKYQNFVWFNISHYEKCVAKTAQKYYLNLDDSFISR